LFSQEDFFFFLDKVQPEFSSSKSDISAGCFQSLVVIVHLTLPPTPPLPVNRCFFPNYPQNKIFFPNAPSSREMESLTFASPFQFPASSFPMCVSSSQIPPPSWKVPPLLHIGFLACPTVIHFFRRQEDSSQVRLPPQAKPPPPVNLGDSLPYWPKTCPLSFFKPPKEPLTIPPGMAGIPSF